MRVPYIIIVSVLLVVVLMIGQIIPSVSFDISLSITVGLVLGFLTFLKPEIGMIFLLISSLFFQEIVVGNISTAVDQSGRGLGIRPDDILLILIMIGWFARLVLRRELISIPRTPLNRPILLLILSIVFSTIIGCFWNGLPLSTGLFYGGKRIQYFVLFLMVITNIRTLKAIKTSVILLLIASGGVAVWGIIEHIIQPEARIAGAFQRSQAPILGGFFIVIIFMALAFFMAKKELLYRVFLLGLMFISLYAVTFTRSRASYVALYIGLIIFALFFRKYVLIAIPVLLVFLTPYIFPTEVVSAINQIGGVLPQEYRSEGVSAPSWNARVDAWKVAIPLILKSPAWGYGPGSYSLAWFDNTYIMDAISFGLIGLGLFLWSLIRMAQTAWNLYKQKEEIFLSVLAMGYIGGLIGLIIHGVAVTTFWNIRIMVPFWFLTGLVMAGWHLQQEKEAGITIENIPETT
jgi:O-antigen ligase